MVIYGDILFLVNLYVDYFLLLGVKSFLHLKGGRLRLILGAVAGGTFSLLSLLRLPPLAAYPLSLAFAALITLIAFYPLEKKALLKATACFFTFSFIFGGMILMLSQLTGRAAIIAGSVYFDISPLFLFLFTLFAYLLSLLLEAVRGGHEPSGRFVKITVENGSCKAELLAKADTGSSLKEPFSGLPVLVAEKETLTELTASLSAVTFRLIPFHSLGGSGLLPAFKPQRVVIKGSEKELNCYLALYDGKLSAGSWNCLMNPEALTITQGGQTNEIHKPDHVHS